VVEQCEGQLEGSFLVLVLVYSCKVLTRHVSSGGMRMWNQHDQEKCNELPGVQILLGARAVLCVIGLTSCATSNS